MQKLTIWIMKTFSSQQSKNRDEIYLREENQIGHNESSIHDQKSINSSLQFSDKDSFASDESWEVIKNNNLNDDLTQENLNKHYNLDPSSPIKDNIWNWIQEVENHKNSQETNEQNFTLDI